ncbi:MAG: hypothetical protein H0U70_01925 [Tatlockia sp.]|nr:hypothetical protein [Tatlockia sp.]
MGIFTEKSKDAINRSASFFTSDWSWWAFELAADYYNSETMLKRSPELLIGWLLFIIPTTVVVYLVLPAFNIISNISFAALNLLCSPIVVPTLAFIHIAKDYFRKPDLELFLELDEAEFDECVVKPIKNYEPNSNLSLELKKSISEPQENSQVKQLDEPYRIEFNKFSKFMQRKTVLSMFFKDTTGNYNCGRGIASHLLDSFTSYQIAKEEQLRAQTNHKQLSDNILVEAERLSNITPK